MAFQQWLNTLVLGSVGLALVLAIVGASNSIEDKIEGATIGGTSVPAVHCQEDEVIAPVGPDRLGCVHYEEVK